MPSVCQNTSGYRRTPIRHQCGQTSAPIAPGSRIARWYGSFSKMCAEQLAALLEFASSRRWCCGAAAAQLQQCRSSPNGPCAEREVQLAAPGLIWPPSASLWLETKTGGRCPSDVDYYHAPLVERSVAGDDLVSGNLHAMPVSMGSGHPAHGDGHLNPVRFGGTKPRLTLPETRQRRVILHRHGRHENFAPLQVNNSIQFRR